MATKRSTAGGSAKRSTVKKSASTRGGTTKKATPRKTAPKKTASKKAAAKKPTKQGAKKRKPRLRRLTSPRLDALSRDEILARAAERAPEAAVAVAAVSCPGCVIQQIQDWGGGTVTGGSQTLRQLSVNAPCSDGRLSDLRQRLRTCSSRTVPLSCDTTVGFILERACPFA